MRKCDFITEIRIGSIKEELEEQISLFILQTFIIVIGQYGADQIRVTQLHPAKILTSGIKIIDNTINLVENIIGDLLDLLFIKHITIKGCHHANTNGTIL